MILLGGILLFSILLFSIYHFFPRAPGSYVNIRIDGKTEKRLPLEKDTTYTIGTKEASNTLQIKDGSASIIAADCPDKLCVHQHKISKKGETLICLPHKLVISIDSSQEGDTYEKDSEDALDGVAK
ncbi:MAG: NusG domain II-containing protein [Lachnospiraceae bacterium]|nr:NusG domain II-containing protein [Lachnospiraceae bacterium]